MSIRSSHILPALNCECTRWDCETSGVVCGVGCAALAVPIVRSQLEQHDIPLDTFTSTHCHRLAVCKLRTLQPGCSVHSIHRDPAGKCRLVDETSHSV